jgi:hypothetical protein
MILIAIATHAIATADVFALTARFMKPRALNLK